MLLAGMTLINHQLVEKWFNLKKIAMEWN